MLFLTLTNPKVSGVAPWVRVVRDARAEYAPAKSTDQVQVRNPKDAAALFRSLELEEVEVFAVAFLDTQRQVIARAEITRGLVNATLVSPREVFRLAVALNAVSLILAHNHPSGIVEPSHDDRAVTRQMVEAGKVLGITVDDHIIVGAGGKFVSFSEAGLL